eukprot:TRINITY_DN16884_c0_g1_i2.p1 TRINITY_DN16884_c0_g1~~TRINITY_DN16884_c0_g1_i2.p1  ORF type:complete len:388 (+),score=58.73 TRINITY_DN16884_c0_g1_i2:52-1215(+)
MKKLVDRGGGTVISLVKNLNGPKPLLHGQFNHVRKSANAVSSFSRQNRATTNQNTGCGHVMDELTNNSPAYSHVTGRRPFSSTSSAAQTLDENNTELKLSYACFERGQKDASKKSPILIHHNLCGRKENLSKIGKQLFHLTRRNILLPDARNHGNSPESQAMSHKLMSGDIIKLLTGLKVKKTSFMGLGIGGRIGMYTALVRPDLVDRLVVVSSSPVNTEKRLREWESLIQSLYVVRTLANAAGHDLSTNTDLLRSQEFRLEANTALTPILESNTDRALFLNNLGKFKASAIHANPDLWKFPVLENCIFKRPVLFLTGEKDRAGCINDDDIRRIRFHFPDSHFVKIPNAGFYPHVDSQDEFLEVVTSFLEADLETLHGNISDSTLSN